MQLEGAMALKKDDVESGFVYETSWVQNAIPTCPLTPSENGSRKTRVKEYGSYPGKRGWWPGLRNTGGVRGRDKF